MQKLKETMKSIPILIISLSLNSICYAQEEISLIDTTKIWNMLYIKQGLGTYSAKTVSYSLNGQVQIDEKTYFHVLRCDNSFLIDWVVTDTLIREELGKVYIKLPSQNEFKTYDFNLLVGDSIKNNYDVGINYIVQSIDTIIVNGKKKRRFFLGPLDRGIDQIWIEGIGCLMDWLMPANWESVRPRFLLCMKDSKTLNTIYSNPNFSSCYISTSTSKKNEDFTIFPNPFIDLLTIKTSIPHYNLEIYYLDGALMLKMESGYTKNLNLRNLRTGMYII